MRNATHNRGNILDLIFSKGIDVDVSSILQVPVSDHSCVFFKVFLSTPTKYLEPDTITYRCIDTTARSILAECLPDLLDSCSANTDSLNHLRQSE